MPGGEKGKFVRLNLEGTAWVMLMYGLWLGCSSAWMAVMMFVKVEAAERLVSEDGHGRAWERTRIA